MKPPAREDCWDGGGLWPPAAGSDTGGSFHPLGFAGQGCEKPTDILFLDILSELSPPEDVVEFGQHGK